MSKTGDYRNITTTTLVGSHHVMDMNTAYGIYLDKHRVPFWRRLWVVVSAVPRYLISGSVEVP